MALPPGISTLVFSNLILQNIVPSPGVETVLQNSVRSSMGPLAWHLIPGATVRVGVGAVITVTGAPWTIRVRIGGVPNSRTDVSGTIVHSFSVPVGVTTVDQISASVAKPNGSGYFQITAESTAGGTCSVNSLTGYVIPDTAAQIQLIPENSSMVHATTNEIVRGQWLVDFSKFSGSQVVLGWACRNFNAVGETGSFLVRMGGTIGGNDGSILMAIVDNTAQAHDGHLNGATAIINNPGGIQLLKVSVRSHAGFAVELRGMTMLIRNA